MGVALHHVFALVLRHRVPTPLRNSARHRMRVTAVVRESRDVVSVVVEGRDLEELRARFGQFFRWRFLTPDLWATAHPSSLSAPPTSTHLRLTMKALGDGSAVLQRLEAGTWVLAEGPYAVLTADRRIRRNVLLIAGGVGITPLGALFESMPLAPRAGPAAALPGTHQGRRRLPGRAGPNRRTPGRPRAVSAARPDRAVHPRAAPAPDPRPPGRDV